MAKAAKKSDPITTGRIVLDELPMGEPPMDELPPIDESRLEREDEESDDADVDHVPDSYYGSDDRPDDDGREEEGGDDSLVTPAQLKILRDGAEKHQTPISYMKISDGCFMSGDKNLEKQRYLSLPDYVVVGRTLFFKAKPVEKHSHFWIEHGSAPPARPKNRFTDRTKWASYNKNGKEYDPFGNTYLAIAFKQKSGGIVLFESSNAEERILIANLVKDFADKCRRPIVELASEPDPDNPSMMRAVFKIIGYDKASEKFDFLRDVMVRDDDEFPEPVTKPFGGFE